MIIVDSSAWIAHLRDAVSAPVERLRRVEHVDDILLGDLILLELLQGARDERHAGRIEAALRRFPIATMLGDELAVLAARHYRALRGKGVTIRKTADLIIATFCIAHEHRLLHEDRDFEPFERFLGLRTY